MSAKKPTPPPKETKEQEEQRRSRTSPPPPPFRPRPCVVVINEGYPYRSQISGTNVNVKEALEIVAQSKKPPPPQSFPSLSIPIKIEAVERLIVAMNQSTEALNSLLESIKERNEDDQT